MAMTSKKTKYVIVMGSVGSGKSNFIWKATGQGQDRVQHGLASASADITTIEYKHPSQADGHTVIFVEAPGFHDLQHDNFHDIARWIDEHLNTRSVLAGIIFLHPISGNRMSGSLLTQLQMFQRVCDLAVMKNVVVATTMLEYGVSGINAQRRQTTWLDGMVENGCKLKEFHDDKDSAWESIDYLLNQKPCPPLPVQREKDQGKRGSKFFSISWF